MIKQIYAFKSHMEQTFAKGRRIPVTSLTVPKHAIVSLGGEIALVAIGEKRKPVGKALQGIQKKLNLSYSPSYLRQVSAGTDTAIDPGGIDLSGLLEAGKLISITSVSKGKGMSGVIKRWNFSTQPRTHGQSDRHRASGSIGRGTTPGRILKGKHMAGRMGGDLKTVKNLKIISYDVNSGILKVEGPTPGARNALTKISL